MKRSTIEHLAPATRARVRRVFALVALALPVFAALALMASARTAAADWDHVISRSMVDGNVVDVRVLVDGRAAPLYQRDGVWDRRYVQAFRGRNYAVELHNTSARRIGVLIAVDGLNVVNGARSRLASTEPMYVLDPYETTVIRGWRTSLEDVRRFVFVDEERSYAERTGQSNGDMGWIRVLAFRESRPALGWGDWRMPRREELDGARRDRAEQGDDPMAENRAEAAPPPVAAAPRAGASGSAGTLDKAAPSAPEASRSSAKATDEFRAMQAPMAEQSVPGTGWGEQRNDPVREVAFTAERTPADRIVLRYEYESGLRALGIVPRGARVWEREHGALGFAKPPQW
jgi:hypothetical protein